MKFLDKGTWTIKSDQNAIMLNETELTYLTDRLDMLSNDILAMRKELPVSYPLDRGGIINNPKFKRPFFNAVNEAIRLRNIKNMLLKAGGNL